MSRIILFLAAALWLEPLYPAQPSQPGTIIDIDFPNAQSGPFMGTASFSGWVLDNASPVASFSAYIDGVRIEGVSYGTARPDVCSLYTSPGCPNVGWNLSADTTQLQGGSHTLTITTVTASGAYATQDATFVVANWTSPSANPIRITVDSPSGKSKPFKGIAAFGGWALDDVAAIKGISVSIDGSDYGSAAYGSPRADACGVYSGRPGCPYVGWNFNLDTSTLSDGTHTLAVTAHATTGQHFTVLAPFSVLNFSGSNPTRINVDVPSAQTSMLSGLAPVSGWALDDISSIDKIFVSVDGRPFGQANTGLQRGDVCAEFPGRSGCPNVGWNFNLDTTLAGDGSHLLAITAQTVDGRKSTAATSFIIDNSALVSPVKVLINQPRTAALTLTGVWKVTGSALDDNSPITSVTALIDGMVFPLTYGLPDSRACIYDAAAANCPNAGWSLQLDTNQLANGNHTLSIVGVAADGQHAATGLSFTVANWTTANPMTIDIDVPNLKSKSLAGVAAISGWALNDNVVLSSVTVQVDGMNFGYAVYGDARPDVCQVYPGRPGCPLVGWHSWLDTTLLSNGPHKLTIVGSTAGGEHALANIVFKVSNPTRVTIDFPNTHTGVLQGTVGFGGWALNDNSAIARIAVLIDGVAYPDAAYGIGRADVCQVYAKRAGCPNVGWGASLDTTMLANGVHTLQITALAAKGQQASAQATFSVEQGGNSLLLGPRGAGRILEQATWGPTASSLQELQSKGFDRWFQDQLTATPSSYTDQPELNANGSSNTALGPVTLQFFQNAVNGQDQLRQRVAFALSEMWVVSAFEVTKAAAFPPLLRIFQDRAFDNYENLIADVTLNPAMGAFLDMVNNVKENQARGTSANENFARELMQLMTIGLATSNPDGTAVLDSNGNPIPTYAQADVTNLAKALTGWTYGIRPGNVGRSINPAYYLVPMVAVNANHDTSAKQFLGVTLAAGNTAQQDLTQALHIIFMQPSLPSFVCRQLIQHLVTSHPSPAYVARVAAVFGNNGNGIRGDLTAVVRAILTDPEARAGDFPGSLEQSDGGHVREPVLYVTNLARGLNIALSSNSLIANQAANLGQPLFSPPSVFSYFSPSYTTSMGLPAPELQLYTTQAAAKYADVAYYALFSGKWDAGSIFDLTPFVVAASSSSSLIDLLNMEFLHESMSDDLQNAIYQAIAPVASPSDKAKAALYTVFTSSDYLVIH